MNHLAEQIKTWGAELGFQHVAITDTDLSAYEDRYHAWIQNHYHGEMTYMEKHGMARLRPDQLVPGTTRIISVRMDYLPPDIPFKEALHKKDRGYIACYALNRDYHRYIRKRLQTLADRITAIAGPMGYRVFCDSAPVLEKPIAEKAGLGWIGKHTNLINSKAGSWFFLGELFTDLPLPIDEPQRKSHCGSCTACIDICPTKAIVGPYQLDARRCISYLTIELQGPIPLEFRSMIGNRIYGCDDCQLICPWNKFATVTRETAFHARDALVSATLIDLFHWSEETFLKQTEGSAIRRIGYHRWLRNVAVALGNAPYDERIIDALTMRLDFPSELVKEHVLWALEEQNNRRNMA